MTSPFCFGAWPWLAAWPGGCRQPLAAGRCRAARAQRHTGNISAAGRWPSALATHRSRRQSGGHPVGGARLGLVHRRQTRRLPDGRLQARPGGQADPSTMSSSLAKQSGKLRITIGDRTVLHYQAEKSELPRADLDPIYRRGGYIHPVVTPGGTVITDDYPLNHKHHHGIWFPWTNTIFEGRKPDFWNMGNRHRHGRVHRPAQPMERPGARWFFEFPPVRRPHCKT